MRTILWTCWWVMVCGMAVPAGGATFTPWPTGCPAERPLCGPNGCVSPPGGAVAPHPAVCRLVHRLPGGLRCLGSGVLVDREGPYGLVLTCQHLFRDGVGMIQASFPDGKTFEARLLHQDQASDLAALLIGQPSADPVPVASRPPRPGEWVQSCGYGPDGRYWCNQGQVLGYAKSSSNTGWDTLELTGRARQGDSGGPVFNASGELVAVVWGTDGQSVSGTYCGRVDRFLQQTGRYLLPWNAKNDPARNPSSGSPADLSRIEARLDQILERLSQHAIPQAGQPGTQTPTSPDRSPDAQPKTDPPLPDTQEASKGSALQQVIDHLVGQIGTLPERIQARIEKVQSSGAQTTPETIRAYVQDFLSEKLADGSLGWTLGKLLAAALGLSGPMALGLTVGAWLIARRIGRKIQAGEPLLVQQLAHQIGVLLGRLETVGSGEQSPRPSGGASGLPTGTSASPGPVNPTV